MTDYDAEADRLSDELDAWLRAHPRDKVTGADARLFDAMQSSFRKAALHAESELRRAEQHFADVARQVREASLHNEELRRGRPIGFLERHLGKPAGAALSLEDARKWERDGYSKHGGR